MSDVHVHHGDGAVAVLVGLENPELAGPLVTRLRDDLSAQGRGAWMRASQSEPVAGALVGMVVDGETLELSWWGRVDVQIATAYGYEAHTGGEEVETMSVASSTKVNVVERAVRVANSSSLEMGTVMAAGCEIALTPQPSLPDAMVEASSTELAPSPSDTIVPVPEGVHAPQPVAARGIEMVRGLRCRNGHHNNPRARLCSLCGDAMQNVSIFVGHDGVLGEMGERPPLGILTLDDGHAYQIGHDTVMGRAPTQSSDSMMVIAFPDDDTMSREHLAIDLDGWNVFVRDLGSSNGTGVRFPDSDIYVRLEPNLRYPLPSNTVLVIGRRWGTFTATSAAPTALLT